MKVHCFVGDSGSAERVHASRWQISTRVMFLGLHMSKAMLSELEALTVCNLTIRFNVFARFACRRVVGAAAQVKDNVGEAP